MILAHKGIKPVIGKNVFIAPTAVVIGCVTIGDNTSIWYGTVLRSDIAPITIGRNTNIQDNCTIHTDVDKPATIGDNVTVGHNAVIHGCMVADWTLVGMNAVILNEAIIKTGAMVAAGAVVREGQIVGSGHLVAGNPAVFKKQLGPGNKKRLESAVADYLHLGSEHMTGTSEG